MAVRSVNRTFLRRRMESAFWFILACYLALIARLLFLQGAHGLEIRAQATRMREQQIPLRAHRGTIYDREGRPLAVSLYAGIVGFDPSIVQPDPKDKNKTARMEQALASSIDRAAAILHLSSVELKQKIEDALAHYDPKAPAARFIPIQKDVPLEVAQQIREARPRLIGFGVQDDSKRVYSNERDSAAVVGSVRADGIGVAGLERSCRRWLEGHPGFAVAEVDDHKREIPDTLQRMIPARDGLDVHTTLDTNAQHIAMEEAQRVYDQYHPKGISVVIVEPTTGDVIALASLPTFDPNPKEEKPALQPKPENKAAAKTASVPTGDPNKSADPKQNGKPPVDLEDRRERCACSLYEPGSTLKALTIAAALDDGTIDLNSRFFCGGTLAVGNKLIHCVLHGAAERGGHGSETPIDILRHSCNVGAAQIGMKMGPKALYAYDTRFGLFDRLHIGLPAEEHGRLSFDRNEKIYTAAKVARVAFGHSVTTTPLHVALAYAAIANGGLLMQPRLIKETTDGNSKVVRKWDTRVVRRVISAKTSAEVCEMLRAVVSSGTGKIAALPGYTIGGKTGTANKYRRGAYVGSFVGFVPANPKVKPKVVILVAVDEPHGAYYGAEVAAPAFHEIARRLLACWRVPEDDPDSTQYAVALENLRRSGQLPLSALHPKQGQGL